MNTSLPAAWIKALTKLDFAFQPIIRAGDGSCYGHEALLRGNSEAGFSVIAGVFDSAYKDGVLLPLELALWTRAIGKFSTLANCRNMKIFCNADNRGIIMHPEYRAELLKVLAGFGLAADTLCLEISEYQHLDPKRLPAGTDGGDGILHALDDFGAEFADVERLTCCPSDIVKIDRIFVSGIDENLHKRVMVKAATAIAHQLGRTVVAEGVETEAEMLTCRLVGCDMLQGYYIQRPTQNLGELRTHYGLIPPPEQQIVA